MRDTYGSGSLVSRLLWTLVGWVICMVIAGALYWIIYSVLLMPVPYKALTIEILLFVWILPRLGLNW